MIVKLNRNLHRYGIEIMNGQSVYTILTAFLLEMILVMGAGLLLNIWQFMKLIHSNLMFLVVLLFLAGTALNYFLVFPLTFRFLGTYQVSAEVENAITLQSYMDTLLAMNLALGIVFELPVLCWLLARLGVLRAASMRRRRRHAVVAVLVAAAVVTPTSDAFTLLLVALPMWLLYEAGIWVVAATARRGGK